MKIIEIAFTEEELMFLAGQLDARAEQLARISKHTTIATAEDELSRASRRVRSFSDLLTAKASGKVLAG